MYRSIDQYKKDDNYCKKGDLITIKTMTVIGVKNVTQIAGENDNCQLWKRRQVLVWEGRHLSVKKSPVRKTSSTERDDMSI
jgi:hypothetical protein